MSTPNHQDLRLKQRSNVTLKAVIIIAGDKGRKHQCIITNLSATGALLECETTASLAEGMNIAIEISIPSTIMHIPNTGTIIWVEKKLKGYRLGIKFAEFLSETMMDQLIHTRKAER